ncbi:LacI family DNA-binding transcriptional regulator [Sphingomonas sp. S2-65]|uniref:LacI family DNA-binding transcriptional regulator n=1 Tax=Sphingomonas sp. S2-65 TaxID=2903960 RepID=UPI001F1E7685|nr:LacI family DNA-binding transcriptional regulator [Sphingomonas sp. S2-65]UYY58154.1 LacI family DNA-binding transcriptional regulator [Sphingomonas sp. S2-65]
MTKDVDRGEIEKPATINDVALRAQVSKKTVSRVINRVPTVDEKIRDRVTNAIRELGFRPNPQARSLAFRRSFLVGLVYDNPSPAYVVNLLEGILDALAGSGFELVVHPCDHQSTTLLDNVEEFVERQRLAGVILPPPLSENEMLVGLLRVKACPYVRISSLALDEPPAMVVTNDHLGAEEAAQQFAQLGHRRIGLVRGPPSFRSADVRAKGFLDTLLKHGITVDPARDVAGSYTFESGLDAGHRLLAMPAPPSAIFAMNDEMALGVMQAARERGLELPRDLSLIGFDDLPMAARVWPNLTSVRLPIREMGQLAARKLLATMGNQQSPDQQQSEVRPVLVMRDSVVPWEG